MKIDYGECPCGGVYENRQVEVRFGNQNVVLKDVPQGFCPNCKSRVYKTEVLEKLETLMKGESQSSS